MLRRHAHDKLLVFLTNPFDLPALAVAEPYRCRWSVELFFKRIKQPLRIKAFFGTSEHAVKTQVRTAIAVYGRVAVVKKRPRLDASLDTILPILSVTLFEGAPLDQRLANMERKEETVENANPLNLFT